MVEGSVTLAITYIIIKKKEQKLTLIATFFFTNRIINAWTNLLPETANTSSVNVFKGRVDREMKRIIFKTNLSELCTAYLRIAFTTLENN